MGTYVKGDKIPLERSEQSWAKLFGFWISKWMDYIFKAAAVKALQQPKRIPSFIAAQPNQKGSRSKWRVSYSPVINTVLNSNPAKIKDYF